MLNVAVVGAGNICPAHIEGYLSFPERCRVVALVDIYPEKAVKIKEKYHLEADVYNDHKDLMNRDDIDIVSICTPPYTHKEIAIDLMKSNIDVLVEKPMASSINECTEMIDAMNDSGSRMSVISQNRFQTPIYNLKKMLELGDAGKVIHAQVDSFWWRAEKYYDLWWRGTWEKEGGGCTLNHAVHHIDILCWMNGLPKRVTSVLANLAHTNSEVEDFSLVVGKYSDGAMSTLTSSLVHHGEDQKIIMQCEKAKISAPWDVYASKGKDNGFFEKDQELTDALDTKYKALDALEFTGHTGQIDDVLTGLESGADFMVTPEQARNTIAYITAVYKSGFTGKPVDLPIDENDEWRTVEGIQKNVKKFYEKTTSVENFEEDTISHGKQMS